MTNKTPRISVFTQVPTTDLSTDNLLIAKTITEELGHGVDILLFPARNSNTVYIKVMGYNGKIYPMVNRNNEIKNGPAAQISTNTVLDRIRKGEKLFTTTITEEKS